VQYTEGTLILDLVDAKTKTLAWQGTAQAEVTQEQEPAKRRRESDCGSRDLMRFPPGEVARERRTEDVPWKWPPSASGDRLPGDPAPR
jgi:hypothetical protein